MIWQIAWGGDYPWRDVPHRHVLRVQLPGGHPGRGGGRLGADDAEAEQCRLRRYLQLRGPDHGLDHGLRTVHHAGESGHRQPQPVHALLGNCLHPHHHRNRFLHDGERQIFHWGLAWRRRHSGSRTWTDRSLQDAVDDHNESQDVCDDHLPIHMFLRLLCGGEHR